MKGSDDTQIDDYIQEINRTQHDHKVVEIEANESDFENYVSLVKEIYDSDFSAIKIVEDDNVSDFDEYIETISTETDSKLTLLQKPKSIPTKKTLEGDDEDTKDLITDAKSQKDSQHIDLLKPILIGHYLSKGDAKTINDKIDFADQYILDYATGSDIVKSTSKLVQESPLLKYAFQDKVANMDDHLRRLFLIYGLNLFGGVVSDKPYHDGNAFYSSFSIDHEIVFISCELRPSKPIPETLLEPIHYVQPLDIDQVINMIEVNFNSNVPEPYVEKDYPIDLDEPFSINHEINIIAIDLYASYASEVENREIEIILT